VNFFRNLFRNRQVDWLQRELQWQQERHQAELNIKELAFEKHLTDVQSLNQTIQYEAMRELAETKKTHAAELNRVIEENQRLREDAKRLQLLVIPALKNVELEPDKTPPPSPSEAIFAGTPWQRILAREIAAQEKAARDKFTRPMPAEGATDGSSREGRDEAPLGGESKPS
jgi:hypothetical protein